ncbi:MAG: SRPBCC domain-containing protein [Geminicoccales bacterium]
MAAGLAEIQKTTELDAPLEQAFRTWTGQIGRWWPLARISVGKADATGCFIEPGIGGRLYETTAGDEHLWGTVAVWEPPRRLAHSWHPGRDLSERTMVLLTFTPLAPARTRLILTHTGWREGDEDRRSTYDRGWDGVLDGYVTHLAGAPPPDR